MAPRWLNFYLLAGDVLALLSSLTVQYIAALKEYNNTITDADMYATRLYLTPSSSAFMLPFFATKQMNTISAISNALFSIIA